jgi:hypothetical protein
MSNQDLPDRFGLAMPDDAMAPVARRGRVVYWSRHIKPTIGAGILVADSRGAFHARQMRQGRGNGHYLASPLNRAYATLDSEHDGLEVVGVWVGLEAGLEDLLP